MLLSAGARSDAIDLAVRAVDLDATDPDAARALARCADASDSADALDAWRVAARLAPDRIDVCARVAELEGAAGSGASGIVAFEKLRQYGDPLSADFFTALALMMSADDRHADAALEARMAKKLAPNDPAVLELCKELDVP
jgi:tetratricopeptide (TPR) repeat protein